MANYIDKQVVNDALDKTCDLVCQYSKKQRYAMCGACPLGSAYDVIENVPSADVQPVRHGNWGKCFYRHGAVWKCSLCGEITDNTVMGIPRFLYCPMCGARMDGE